MVTMTDQYRFGPHHRSRPAGVTTCQLTRSQWVTAGCDRVFEDRPQAAARARFARPAKRPPTLQSSGQIQRLEARYGRVSAMYGKTRRLVRRRRWPVVSSSMHFRPPAAPAAYPACVGHPPARSPAASTDAPISVRTSGRCTNGSCGAAGNRAAAVSGLSSERNPDSRSSVRPPARSRYADLRHVQADIAPTLGARLREASSGHNRARRCDLGNSPRPCRSDLTCQQSAPAVDRGTCMDRASSAPR